MRQKIEQHHNVDKNGNPAGGHTKGMGFDIWWQNGPLGRGSEKKEPNGAFVEELIQAAIGRLEFYQTASQKKFACRENALAITKLQEALFWLEERTRQREEREVEGTHAP